MDHVLCAGAVQGLTLLLTWSCRWGAWPVPVRGGGARQVDGVQLEGEPPRRAERPTARQTGVRLFHQNMGAGLRRDGGDAVLLPPQHHPGTLRALPAGDGSGNSHTEIFSSELRGLAADGADWRRVWSTSVVSVMFMFRCSRSYQVVCQHSCRSIFNSCRSVLLFSFITLKYIQRDVNRNIHTIVCFLIL